MQVLLFPPPLSSLLFSIPCIYAFYHEAYDVAYACLACLFTSFTYHTYRNPRFRIVDVLIVRTISTLYVLHAIFKLGVNINTCGLYFFTLVTLIYYCFAHSAAHAPIHLFAIIGILFYVRAKITRFKNNQLQ